MTYKRITPTNSILKETTSIMASQPKVLPRFDELPLRDGDPPNSAWGLWGDGPGSSLGSLNYLTDELVQRTIKEEVKTGERVCLK